MANSISLVTTFLQLIDDIYKLESLTAPMDALTQDSPDFAGSAAVKVMKIAAVGLGDYSRTSGYPAGDVTATWETLTLAKQRGRSFSIDRMDNEESLGLLLGNLIRVWMKNYVAPEIDAYRFATYASWSNVVAATPATLSASTILSAIDTASQTLDEAEVPSEGRKLYISATCGRYLDTALTRFLSTEKGVDRRMTSLDGVDIVRVPQARFYTIVDLNAGATSNVGGFSKNASGKDINFMMLHPSAVLQATKLNNVKYFAPEINQLTDGHLWQYRLYHDAFVYENKENGIYLHNKA